MRPTLGVAFLLLGVALLMPSCARLDFFKRKDNPQTCNGPCVGSLAPEIDGETFDGSRVKLSDYRGKVVVVVFWFAGCGPCRAMIPHERELAERYRDKPFSLLSVYGDVDYDNARNVIAAQHMNWPIVKSQSSTPAITARYGVKCFPSVFVIDATGIVRYAGVGSADFDGVVASLLKEMDAKR
jgi:thiol-disulfide isomerase/thioredoxin